MTNIHTDTNRKRKSDESLSESSITTNWNSDVHESSRSLGHTERFIQPLWAQLRTLRTQMGDKCSKLQITTTHPIVGWAIRHASWILTRYLRHADGKISYDLRWQRPHAFPLCIFGETVMYAEQMMVLPKHVTRFNSGIWVGRCTISNTHLVVDGKRI